MGHTLAVSGGRVFAWGRNNEGAIGDGGIADRRTPFQVPGLTGISTVASGVFHSLALTSDHRVFAWSSNSSGELGDGTTATARRLPVQVPGLTNVQQIDGGNEFTLAIVT